MYRDVFDSDLRMARHVCVVAPGPNGRQYYSRIPDNYQVMVVSKAVLIPEVRPEIWVMNQFARDWCRDADAGFRGIRLFSKSAATAASRYAFSLRGIASGRFTRHLSRCYSYRIELADGKRLDKDAPSAVVPGMVRGFGSVSGCAIQLAYLCGARRILLCGVDMSGDNYWDGTATNPPRDEVHGPEWWFVPRLNNLIRWLQGSGGAVVRTLSPTKLEVPYFSEAETGGFPGDGPDALPSIGAELGAHGKG